MAIKIVTIRTRPSVDVKWADEVIPWEGPGAAWGDAERLDRTIELSDDGLRAISISLYPDSFDHTYRTPDQIAHKEKVDAYKEANGIGTKTNDPVKV